MAIKDNSTSERTPLLNPAESEGSSETFADSESSSIDHDKANQSVGRLRAVLIIFSLWILIFFQASNMSGLTTTQSTIAADLDAFSEANWFTSAYLIAMSSLAPLAGRLSQLFSPRILIFVSAILFAIGGLVTSQASRFPMFIVGRAISGIGGAGILTVSIILVLELSGKKRRGLFIGLVNAGYTSGVALGAVIAGALLPVTGWRAMFWIQTPIALVAGTGVFFSIPSSFTSGADGLDDRTLRQKLSKVDYLGAVTLTSSIVLFLYGLSSANIQWLAILISAVSLITFILNEIYLAHDPVIPLSVLSSRGTLLTCAAQLLFMAARWTVLFYTPVYAIAVRSWSPSAAGSILIPTNLGFACGGLLVGGLHVRRAGSFYLPTLLSFVLFVVTLTGFALASTALFPAWTYILLAFCNGLCTGAALTYTLAHILHLSPTPTHFIASSLLATFRGFAGSFGSAIGGGIFQRLLRTALETGFAHGDADLVPYGGRRNHKDLIRRLLGSPALVQGLDGVQHTVAVRAYETALRGLFFAAAASALAALVLQTAAGFKKAVEEGDGVGVGAVGGGQPKATSEAPVPDEAEEAEGEEVNVA